MPGIKLSNDYAQQFGKLYEATPKAVFAAIAYSMCFIAMEEDHEEALARFMHEWEALYHNRIVPQPPAKGWPGPREPQEVAK